jgi:hypothetical protein
LTTAQKVIIPKVVDELRRVGVVVGDTDTALPRDLVFLLMQSGHFKTMKGNRNIQLAIGRFDTNISIARDTKVPGGTRTTEKVRNQRSSESHVGLLLFDRKDGDD